MSIGIASYLGGYSDTRKTANSGALGIGDQVKGILDKSRADSMVIRAELEGTVFGAIAASAALSLVPFESNFGSVFAGRMLADLARPAVAVAINGPIEEALRRIFPTKHLGPGFVRYALTKGMLDATTLVAWARREGMMDEDIVLLSQIANYMMYEHIVAKDEALLLEYNKILLTETINTDRADADLEISDTKAQFTAAKKALGVKW